MSRTSHLSVPSIVAMVAVVALTATTACGVARDGASSSDAEVEVLDLERATAGVPTDFDEWTSDDVCRAVPGATIGRATEIAVVGSTPFTAGAPQCSYDLDTPGTHTELVVGVLRPAVDLGDLTGDAALLHAAVRHLPSVGTPSEIDERVVAQGSILVRGPITQTLFVLVDGSVVTVSSHDLDAMTIQLVAEQVVGLL